ncbi:MAG: very short patch repair endonuclease [Bacteroidia bacterium]
MADIVSKERRSEIMSKIRGVNTKPELVVRQYLFSKGFRYTLHNKSLAGRPDISIKKYNCLIFVNGCFWHGHTKCNIAHRPKTNKKFWNAKILGNIKRDRENLRELRKEGWKVIVIWECQLKSKQRERTLQQLVNNILP